MNYLIGNDEYDPEDFDYSGVFTDYTLSNDVEKLDNPFMETSELKIK